MSNPLPAQNPCGVQYTSRSRPCGSLGTCPEFRMWRFGPADGLVVAQLAQCSPPTAFSPVSNTIQRLCCSYSWAVSYPQCVCHLPYLRKALTWSIPFKLGLFFPSLDPQVSIAVSSLWHLHPFFSRHLTSHNAFQRQLEGPGTIHPPSPPSPTRPSFPKTHSPADKPTTPASAATSTVILVRPLIFHPPHPTYTPPSLINKMLRPIRLRPRILRKPPRLRLLRLQRLPGPGRDVRRRRHQHVHRREQQHLLRRLLEHGPDSLVPDRLRHPRPAADRHAGRRLHVVVVRRRAGGGDGAADDGEGCCCCC